MRKRRAQLRERRHKASVPTVALVGYTNAGKTTLFNVLTRADAEASNALFVTLDPLVRQVRLPDSRELLVSDTVGFIDRLPHALVAAFRATLEETADADLVLHVIDASAPDRDRRDERGAQRARRGRRDRRADARGLQQVRRADAGRAAAAAGAGSVGAVISALTGRASMSWSRPSPRASRSTSSASRSTFDPDSTADRERIARVYRHARVVLHETRDDQVSIVADVPRRLLEPSGLIVLRR